MEGLLDNYRGVTITVGISGLPMVITGEVVYEQGGVVALRLEDKRTVYISVDDIAFFN